MKAKLSHPPVERDPQPERDPDYREYEPRPMKGCICPPAFIRDGEIFQAHNPACLVPGHGMRHRPLPPVSVYFADTRTVGIAKPPRRGQG